MPSRRAYRTLVLLGAVLFFSTALTADVSRSRADADQLLRKLAVIETNGLATHPAARRTEVSEGEVNSFLLFHLRDEIPAGISDPVITIDDAGRLHGRAIVDLDEVQKAQGGGAMSAMALLGGRVPIEAAGILRTSAGVGQFVLESATVAGVPVPKTILQQVVSYYSRSPETPDGIDLDAPFQLPARIREIQTRKGQAVIVQ